MIRQQFVLNSNFRRATNIFLGLGVLALILGSFFLAFSNDEISKTRFWSVLLHNSVFFLLLVNASMFFICITTMAWGGWHISFVRVPEVISSLVKVYSVLVFVVFLGIIFGHQHNIYHWLDADHVKNDPVLNWKKFFLNPYFFLIWTSITLIGWCFLGAKMRKLSLKADFKQLSSSEGKKFIKTSTVWASLFVVFFALTAGSTIPWLWLMSIDAHWYSTMYSWYTFASIFVAGMSLILLVVVYLKKNDYLEYLNKNHLHDLGKFMFAFSIFWCYLWFSQYMLIWYANIPEETGYFKIRQQGPYSFLFYFNIVVNFLLPFLMLMRNDVKRNYSILVFTAFLIIIGHWFDFFQMIMPGSVGEHYSLLQGWFEFGVLFFYVGLTMLLIGRGLTKVSLIPLHHPFLKESVIHRV